jgi:type VI secretion system protein ImpH
MERQQVYPIPPLKADLLSKASQINFYRFCQLLELSAPDSPLLGSQESVNHDAVRFRADSSMGFPTTDLKYKAGLFENEAIPVPVVYTTFLSLIGVDGVLPFHILTNIVTRKEGSEVLASFLDIFHHRMVIQYYRIWRKYHYPVGFTPGGNDKISQVLQGLTGRALSKPSTVEAESRWLALLGPLSRRSRSADGLVATIRHVLPEIGVRVTEFHNKPILLEASKLGRHTQMNRGDIVLGRRINDCSRSIKVVLQPTTKEELMSLFPGQATRKDLDYYVSGYLGLRWEVSLLVQVSLAILPPIRIGRDGCRLGLDAHLPWKNGKNNQDSMVFPLGRINA